MSRRDDWRATAGMVRLIAWPDTEGAARGYARLDGACSPHWRRAPRAELVAKLFIVYAKMVLQGMNPIGAHLALSGLDEYRDNLPPELAMGEDAPRAIAQVVRLEDYRRPLPAVQNG